MANPLKLGINNITQSEIDKLVQVFHAANALCIAGLPFGVTEPNKLIVVPKNGFDMLQSLTQEFSDHIGDGKEVA